MLKHQGVIALEQKMKYKTKHKISFTAYENSKMLNKGW